MDGCINCQHVKILLMNLTSTALLEDMGSLLDRLDCLKQSILIYFDKFYLPVYQ